MNTLRFLINLIESYTDETLLFENFTKGSNTVLSNNKLVKNLAIAVREDVKYNRSSFPNAFVTNIKNMSDQAIAEWFLTELDKIEAEGYEGTTYSRNGSDNVWVVTSYINGDHNWEDVSGTLSMNLSKFYYLRNRDLLDALHKDLGKAFNGVRELGSYLVIHYSAPLANYMETMKAKALERSIRAFKLIDNNEYRIYTTLNRAANIKYGLGTTWCTASSSHENTFFNNYASRAMLFQLFPYDAKKIETTDARKRKIEGHERYQFDAGGPHFMNIADLPPDKNYIKSQYPYLYYDLKTALENQKSQLQSYIDEHASNPVLEKDRYSKVIRYDVNEEIAKLERLKTAGWFTDEVRPPESNNIELTPDNKQLPSS